MPNFCVLKVLLGACFFICYHRWRISQSPYESIAPEGSTNHLGKFDLYGKMIQIQIVDPYFGNMGIQSHFCGNSNKLYIYKKKNYFGKYHIRLIDCF